MSPSLKENPCAGPISLSSVGDTAGEVPSLSQWPSPSVGLLPSGVGQRATLLPRQWSLAGAASRAPALPSMPVPCRCCPPLRRPLHHFLLAPAFLLGLPSNWPSVKVVGKDWQIKKKSFRYFQRFFDRSVQNRQNSLHDFRERSLFCAVGLAFGRRLSLATTRPTITC